MDWLTIRNAIASQQQDSIHYQGGVFSEEDAEQLKQLLSNFNQIRVLIVEFTYLTNLALGRLIEILKTSNAIIQVDFIRVRLDHRGEISQATIKDVIQLRIHEYESLYNECVQGRIESVKKYLARGFHYDGLHSSKTQQHFSLLSGALLSRQYRVAKLLLQEKIKNCNKLGDNTLDLSCRSLDVDALVILFEELNKILDESAVCIWHIDLSHNSVAFASRFAEKLVACEWIRDHLRTVDLSYCGIYEVGLLGNLSTALKACPSLEKVVFDNNKIEYSSLERFLQYFPKTKKLKLISLINNLIERNAVTFPVMTDLIASYNQIDAIALSGNYLMNDYRASFAEEPQFYLSNLSLVKISSGTSLLNPDCRISLDNWRVYFLAKAKEISSSVSAMSHIEGGHAMLAFEGMTHDGQRIFKVAHLTVRKSSAADVTISYYTRHESLLELVSHIKQSWCISDFSTTSANCLSLWHEVATEIEQGVPYYYRPLVVHTPGFFAAEEQTAINCVKWAINKIEKHLKISLPPSIGCLPMAVVRDSLHGQHQGPAKASPKQCFIL